MRNEKLTSGTSMKLVERITVLRLLVSSPILYPESELNITPGVSENVPITLRVSTKRKEFIQPNSVDCKCVPVIPYPKSLSLRPLLYESINPVPSSDHQDTRGKVFT